MKRALRLIWEPSSPDRAAVDDVNHVRIVDNHFEGSCGSLAISLLHKEWRHFRDVRCNAQTLLGGAIR